MPPASGLLRLSLVIAAVFAAGIGALVAASALVPTDSVRGAVIAQIRAVTGLEPAIRGEVTVSLFPTAMVSFSDIVLGDAADAHEPALIADRLTAKLQLLPLLVGNIEPADMSLTRPRITVRLEPDGRSNWSNLAGDDGAHAQAGHAAGRPARAVVLGDPRERRNHHGGRAVARGAEELSDVELSFAWPSISRSSAHRPVRRGATAAFDASANAADLLAALSGDRSGLKVRIAGAPFKLAFDGHISQRPTLKMEGTLAMDGRSLREAMRWAGRQPLPGGGVGPFALKAQSSLIGGNWVLSGANIELDGNVAEGVLAFTTEPRMTVKGTLAADALDLIALRVDHRTAARERARLEPRRDRDRRARRFRPRPAPLGGARDGRDREARPHRRRRQPARRTPHASRSAKRRPSAGRSRAP